MRGSLSRFAAPTVLLAATLAWSCGAGGERTEGARPTLAPLDAARAEALTALRARQATRDPRYALTRGAPSALVGTEVTGASLRLDEAGVHLRAGAASFDLRLARIGRGRASVALPDATPSLDEATPNRATFRRGAVDEWYQNGPDGLEQGFELASPPAVGAGPLVLELATGGLRPETDGARVDLRDAQGVAASIRDLVVVDADAHEVPARFEVDGARVRIAVEDAGARYPLHVDPIIGIGAVLRPADGSIANAGFGFQVRARGDRVIVGDFRTNVGAATQAGAAYVYVRSGTGWVQEGKLTAPTPVAYDEVGTSVDIDGDTAVASSWKNNAQRGAVYVFKRVGSTWSYAATLTIAGALGGIGLGNAVALDGGVLAATSQAAQKKLWVFNSLVSGAAPAATVTSADTTLVGWGISVGFQGGTLAVGCPDYTNTASAVAVYVGSGASWSLQTTLRSAGISYGRAVDVDGNAIVVYGNNAANTAAGGFVYRRSGTAWALETSLFPNWSTGKYQGGSVSISGEVALVSGAESGVGGAVSVYRHASGATWNELGKLSPLGGVGATNFNSVGLDGDTAVVGAYQANLDSVLSAGAAFVWHPVVAWSNAHACVDAAQCNSGLCVDGVCCNAPCTESCKACNVAGSAGTCSAVPAGAPVGARTCAPSKSCAAGGVCSAACTTTADCATGYYCGAGTCLAKKDPGAGCDVAGECKSGFCADGVCCNVACGGQCEACDVPTKGGTCTPVIGKPHTGKPACAGATSGADADCAASCNGVDAAACHYPTATAACGKDGCAAGIESKVGKCDGAGKCGATSRACSPFGCDSTTCRVSCAAKSDCAAGYSCVGSVCVASASLGATCTTSSECLDGLSCTDGVCCGVADCGADRSCAAKATDKGHCYATQGASCAGPLECASGNCVDGVCCDTACDGQCEACDLSGDGTCGPVTGAPHGARPACDAGADVCSARACDGAARGACAGYKAGPAVTCKPAQCTGDAAQPESTCDGKGHCEAPAPSSCGKYRCDPATSACRGACASADECAAGFSCNAGICSTGATCSADGLSSIDASGTKSCAPFVCGGDGSCLESCASSTDCAPGTTCDVGTRRCLDAAEPVGTSESGGCATPRGGGAGNVVGLLLGAAFALGALGRRARRGAK